jgi:Dolichyl-phosphate-mannose-protein mannosyltransferase
MRLNASYLTADRVLVSALLIASVLVLNGIWWGWVECWNPDQMALLILRSPSVDMFSPPHFLKPPLYSYLNFFLSILPLKTLEKVVEALTHSTLEFEAGIIWWSRLIQLGLFLGSIAGSYYIVKRASGKPAARIVVLIMGTSAGFVLQAHFLTSDIPVTFGMLASLIFAQSIAVNGIMRNYVLAGLLAGLAMATKYNGLAIGLAIPIFHYFANASARFHKLATDPRLVAGVSMTAVGFVLGNPYSVIEFRRFTSDFIYNYSTTPVYDGTTTGTGYLSFLLRIVEILGWPATLIITTALIATISRLKRLSSMERATVAATLGVFVLYFLKFGSPPRVEVRFVLPVVPLLLIAGAPFFSDGKVFSRIGTTVLGLALTYNCIASLWVGYRFATDPRMGAQAWIAAHVSPGSLIESSPYSPMWNKYPGIYVKDVRMPFVSTRNRMFAEVFSNDSTMQKMIDQREPDKDTGWYDLASLASRKPDFIVLDDAYYDRFVYEPGSRLYPEIRDYVAQLLEGRSGYEVVYDNSFHRSPSWLYPSRIGFVDNRIVILKRTRVPFSFQEISR